MLGGSAQQVIAIKTAKRLGLRVILCDYLTDNPGQEFADVYYSESTTDEKAIYRIAVKEKIDGILAYASDPAALPASKVAEYLNLPTNPSKSIQILGIKSKFREFLQNNGFTFPKFFVFNTDLQIDDIKNAISYFEYPIVIKPTDSSGSKGITKLYNADKLEEAITFARVYSRNQILIAEEFICRGYPNVIGGDIFVENGQIVLFGAMDCLRGKIRPLIPIGKMFPTNLSLAQNIKIQNELQRLIEKLDLKFGEFNIEILLDNKDNVHFLELGPRAGGNMIPIQLGDAFGVDLVEANIKAAIGEKVILKKQKRDKCLMTHVLHSNTPGYFQSVEFSNTLKPYIYKSVVYKKTGDTVDEFNNAGKALGIIFMTFPSIEKMHEISRQLDNLVKINLKR